MKFTAQRLSAWFLILILAGCAGQSGVDQSKSTAANTDEQSGMSKNPLRKDPVPPVIMPITCKTLVLGPHLQASIAEMKKGPQCGWFQDKRGYRGPQYKVSRSMREVGSPGELVLADIAIYNQQLKLNDLGSGLLDVTQAPPGVSAEVIDTGLVTRDGIPVRVVKVVDVESGVNFTCVGARKPSSQMTPLQILVCRSLAHDATNSDIQNEARRITTDDVDPVDIRL